MDSKSKGNILSSLESGIESINEKLPALPAAAKDWIVKALPWVILIFGILTLISVLGIFVSFGAIFGAFGFLAGATLSVTYWITWVISIIIVLMELSAVKGLMARRVGAWRILFYTSLLSALNGILSNSIPSMIISVVISLYLLFQIKSYYK